MNEITPEVIASIATRLYRQLPNGSVGVAPSGHMEELSNLPGNPNPPGNPVPAPTMALPSLSSVPQVNSALTSPLGIPSLRGLPVAVSSVVPAGAAVPAMPDALGSSSNGLRQFVSNLRSNHAAGENGLCGDDPALREIRRRFASRSDVIHSSRPFDVVSVRKDFPILQQRIHSRPLVWLDNAATTQKPRCVIEALSRFYENNNSNIHRGADTLAARATDAYEEARNKVQRFVGASSAEEIIFVRGTTEGINLVAKTFGRKFLLEGDEILLSTLEHHANIVPWQMIAHETGATIRVIPVNDHGEILLEEYQRLLGPKTRLVALTQASNSLGTILPVEEMTQMAKRYGARVLIDGAQSVAHIPVNVQQLDCDFFVFSGHKIFGPTGIGAVYGKKELLEIMPPWQGGGNMIRDVTFEETTYHGPPARFEAGTPNVADAVGLGVALDYVNRLGLSNIAKYERELLQHGTELLSAIDGLRLIGTAKEKVGVLSFVLDGHSTEDVGRRLDQEGIAVRAGHHCSQPSLRRFGLESTVRPSLSLYNTHDEVNHLAAAIHRIRHR